MLVIAPIDLPPPFSGQCDFSRVNSLGEDEPPRLQETNDLPESVQCSDNGGFLNSSQACVFSWSGASRTVNIAVNLSMSWYCQ